LDFWRKFGFLTKIWILDENLDFNQNFILDKILISVKISSFPPCRFLNKIYIFCLNFYIFPIFDFWPKFCPFFCFFRLSKKIVSIWYHEYSRINAWQIRGAKCFGLHGVILVLTSFSAERSEEVPNKTACNWADDQKVKKKSKSFPILRIQLFLEFYFLCQKYV